MASGLRSAPPIVHGSRTLVASGTTIGGRSMLAIFLKRNFHAFINSQGNEKLVIVSAFATFYILSLVGLFHDIQEHRIWWLFLGVAGGIGITRGSNADKKMEEENISSLQIKTNSPAKIQTLLFITPTVDHSDSTHGFILHWIERLAKNFDRMVVVTRKKGTGGTPSNVQVHSMGAEQGYSRLRRIIEFYRHLLRILSNERVSICMVHMIPLYAIMAWPLLFIRRIPIILWYTHTDVTPTLRIAHFLVHKVVTASKETFRIPSGHVEVTGHGIDTEVFRPSPSTRTPHPFRILSLGRLSPIKRIDVLIKAISILRNQHPETEFACTIVGAPRIPEQIQYAEKLKEQAAESGLDSVIDFAGEVPHHRVPEYYQEAELFVDPSGPVGSGLDKVVLEAMSCGVPILSSNQVYTNLLGDLSSTLLFPAVDEIKKGCRR